MDHASAEHLDRQLGPALGDRHHGAGLGCGVWPHALFLVVAGYPEGHQRNVGELGVLLEDAGQCVLEDVAVVDPRADDDLAVHLHPGIEQGPQPPQAGGASGIAQHLGARMGVGGVDRHVQRAEPLGDHPFQVGLGKPREGCEVAVQKRQSIVVVSQRQAAAHPRRQLVDEAELAVVVARAHPVENCRVHLDAQRRTGLFKDFHLGFQPAAGHLEVHLGLVGEHPPLDDVADRLAVDAHQLVANDQPCQIGGAVGRYGDDDRG